MIGVASEVDNDEVLREIRDAGEYDLLGDGEYVCTLCFICYPVTSNYFLALTHSHVQSRDVSWTVEVYGIAQNVSKSLFTFDIDADQYHSFLKAVQFAIQVQDMVFGGPATLSNSGKTVHQYDYD